MGVEVEREECAVYRHLLIDGNGKKSFVVLYVPLDRLFEFHTEMKFCVEKYIDNGKQLLSFEDVSDVCSMFRIPFRPFEVV